MKKILTIFGTRPEVIKIAPVIRELERCPERFETINVTTGQHSDLLYPFIELFKLRVDHDLQVMDTDQTPGGVCARALMLLEPLLKRYRPDMLLVQGDTSTTLAGALAGFYNRVPVGHIEAGLRSGDLNSPYPEEMNRILVSRLATYHFAATARNRETLLREGVDDKQIFVTGNPVVDALNTILETPVSARTRELFEATEGKKRLVVTLHRRESLESRIVETLKVLRDFVAEHSDVAMIFPVHPNPRVTEAASKVLGAKERVLLTAPLGYQDFIHLLSASWLIVSDSGGIQEEAPSLRKPLLVVRENTERSEAMETGFIQLVSQGPARLRSLMEELYSRAGKSQESWSDKNPFGEGDSGKQIVRVIADRLGVQIESAQIASVTA